MPDPESWMDVALRLQKEGNLTLPTGDLVLPEIWEPLMIHCWISADFDVCLQFLCGDQRNYECRWMNPEGVNEPQPRVDANRGYDPDKDEEHCDDGLFDCDGYRYYQRFYAKTEQELIESAQEFAGLDVWMPWKKVFQQLAKTEF